MDAHRVSGRSEDRANGFGPRHPAVTRTRSIFSCVLGLFSMEIYVHWGLGLRLYLILLGSWSLGISERIEYKIVFEVFTGIPILNFDLAPGYPDEILRDMSLLFLSPTDPPRHLAVLHDVQSLSP